MPLVVTLRTCYGALQIVVLVLLLLLLNANKATVTTQHRGWPVPTAFISRILHNHFAITFIDRHRREFA